MPANKNRRRSPKKRQAARKKSSKKALLDDEFQQLHAKIGVLENFITRSAAEETRRRSLTARNMIPPPDRTRAKAVAARRTRWEERQHLVRRERSGLGFLALLVLACAIAWWLLNS